MAASTYGFGAENIYSVKTDVNPGSGSITLGDTFSPENIEKTFSTPIAQGTFLTDDGLVAFDSSPIFVADSGQLAKDFNVEQSPTKEQTSVSSRPYIWKYQ